MNSKQKSSALMTRLLATMLIILSIMLILNISCQPVPPTTIPKEPENSLPPDTDTTEVEESASNNIWSADGIITPGEYLSEMSYGNGDYEIYWFHDEVNIYIGIKAKTTGWVSMAVQPGSRMLNADMVLGFVQDGEVSIYDLFSTGSTGPHLPDTELGGTDDIAYFSGGEADGYTTIEFQRALVTGDKYDNKLSQGEVNQIIWAFGSSDALSLRHTKRGYGEIDLQ